MQSLDHENLKLCHSGRVPGGPWEVTCLKESARCQSRLFMAELSLPGLTHHSHPPPNTRGEEEVHAQGSLETLRQLLVEDGFFQSHLPTVGEHSFGKALGQILPSTKGGSCGDRDSEPDAQRGRRSCGLGSRKSRFYLGSATHWEHDLGRVT